MQDISGIAVGASVFVETSDGELLHATLCAYDSENDLVAFQQHLGSNSVMQVMRRELIQRVEIVAPTSESYLPQGRGPFGESQLRQAMLLADDSRRPDFLATIEDCDASHAELMLRNAPFDNSSRVVEGEDAATDAESVGGVVDRDIVEQMPDCAQSRCRSELSISWSSSWEAGSTQRGSSGNSSLRDPYEEDPYVNDNMTSRSGTEDLLLRVRRTRGGRRRRRRSSFNQVRDDVRELHDVRDLSMAGQGRRDEIQDDSDDVLTASPEFHTGADEHSTVSFAFPCWDEEEEEEREHRKDKDTVADKRSFERFFKDPPSVSSWETTAAQFRNDTKTIERNNIGFRHILQDLDRVRLSLSRAVEQLQADQTELTGYLTRWPRESDDPSCALQPPGSSGAGRPDDEGWDPPKFGQDVP